MALSIAPSGHWMGNDGPWSTFAVKIGNSSESLEVLPASSVSLTLVVLEDGCPPEAPANCGQLRGNIFNGLNSATWEPLKAEDGQPYANVSFPALQALLPEPVTAAIGVDSLRLTWLGDLSVKDPMPLEGQLIAAYAAKSPFLGMLGLSGWQVSPVTESISYNSPLQTLENKSTVSGRTWAYTAGARYKDPVSYGSLTFGGYDSSLVHMDEALTGVGFTGTRDGNGNELTLMIKAITVGDTTSTGSEFGELVTLLDSALPDIWLPQSVCDIFEKQFDLKWNETAKMYMIDEEQRERLQTENTSVTFTLAPTFGEGGVNITLPYLAFDHEVKYPLLNIMDDRTLYYFPLKPMPNDTTGFKGLLGRTFFQEA